MSLVASWSNWLKFVSLFVGISRLFVEDRFSLMLLSFSERLLAFKVVTDCSNDHFSFWKYLLFIDCFFLILLPLPF